MQKQPRKGEPLYTKHTHGFLTGFVLSITYGFWAFVKTMQMMFSPKMSPAISNAYGHMDRQSDLTIENKNPEDIENGLQIGYTIDEMVTRAEEFFTRHWPGQKFCSDCLYRCAWKQQCQ